MNILHYIISYILALYHSTLATISVNADKAVQCTSIYRSTSSVKGILIMGITKEIDKNTEEIDKIKNIRRTRRR